MMAEGNLMRGSPLHGKLRLQSSDGKDGGPGREICGSETVVGKDRFDDSGAGERPEIVDGKPGEDGERVDKAGFFEVEHAGKSETVGQKVGRPKVSVTKHQRLIHLRDRVLQLG